MRFSGWLFLISLATLVLSPSAGSAQGVTPERVRMATDLQGRARSAAGSGQFSLGGQPTAQARGRADRAITPARGLPTRERLGVQCDRTGEMLDRSRARIQECGDDRARALLRVALEMQERARSAEQSGRYLGALQLTMGARERCLRALRLCHIEESVQQAAERALSRTDQVLTRAREQLESGAYGGAVPRRVCDALARAAALQDDASRQFRDGHCEASLQLTLTARRLAHRALRRGWPRVR
jgi:hypothetical protein